MDDRDDQRETALKRVKAKRDFRNHVAAGYFWPIWIIASWGVGLAFNAWAVYFEKPITEDEIRREMEHGT